MDPYACLSSFILKQGNRAELARNYNAWVRGGGFCATARPTTEKSACQVASLDARHVRVFIVLPSGKTKGFKVDNVCLIRHATWKLVMAENIRKAMCAHDGCTEISVLGLGGLCQPCRDSKLGSPDGMSCNGCKP